MSYNWQSASTPQGRERLKELLENGVTLIAYLGLANRYADISLENGTYFIDGDSEYDSIEELINDDDYFRFLDPEPPKPQPDKTHAELGFGDYVCIEQFRYGVPNEFYQYKVIGSLRSNSWVDIPVKDVPTEILHDSMEDVLRCVCCGVNETKVMKYRLSEVVPHGRYWEMNYREGGGK